MTFFIKTIALLSFLILTQASIANEQPAQTSEAKPKTLEELKIAIEKIRKDTNTPAVGIALVNKDGPYWIAGLGEADMEKHIKADENTMFRIASVSKMFVALSVLKLVEEGKLNLNDKLHDLAPEIKFENKWEKTNPVLLIHLLEHTTGWDDLHLHEFAYNASDTSSLKDALDFHPDSRTSRWVPGTRYAYNNTGPGVTAYIIEKITGKKYEDYVQENFLNNLQMNTSTFYNSNTYKLLGAKLYNNNQTVPYLYTNYRPSGAMNSSAKEMANFLFFLINRGKYSDLQLIQEKSIERMEIPVSNLGAKEGITAGYGLHNHTTGHGDYGIALHGHGGELRPGALTAMMYSPELKTGYIIMTNTSNGSIWQMTELVTEYLLKGAKKAPAKAINLSSKFNEMSGIYMPLNPRQEGIRFQSDIMNTIKVSVYDNKINRSPLFGGWESNDYAIAENIVVNPWTGLPSIAFVNDPIAGESLQVEGELYKRVPALFIYGGIALCLLLVILILINIIAAVIWFPRMLLGKLSKGATIKIRTWPLIASLAIIATFLLIGLYGENITMLGTFTWVSISIFISSVLYAILTMFSLLSIYKYRNEPVSRIVFWNALIVSILHALLVIYLSYYGVIGFRGWAE